MTKLQTIIKEQGLAKTDKQILLDAFGAPFEDAGVILATYKSIKVTKETDFDLMEEARTQRLELKKTRIAVEKKRKELKADIVKQGRAIDSVAKFVKDEIEPAEAYLLEQEKFAELRQAERAAILKAERTAELMQYTDDISMYMLDELTDYQYDSLLKQVQAAHALQQAEVERLAKQAEADAQARADALVAMEAENERLRAEAQARIKEEQAKQSQELKEHKRMQAIIAGLTKYAEDLNKIADCSTAHINLMTYYRGLNPSDAQAVVAENAYIKTEQAIQERQAELEAIEADQQAHEQASAPDKAKLQALAQQLIALELPTMATDQGQQILVNAQSYIAKITKYLTDESSKI